MVLLRQDGIMLSNTTINSYLLTNNGAMATNGWQKSTKIGTMQHPLEKFLRINGKKLMVFGTILTKQVLCSVTNGKVIII